MKSTIKLISGAAILLQPACPVKPSPRKPSRSACPAKYFPFTFVKQDKLQGFEGGHVEPDR